MRRFLLLLTILCSVFILQVQAQSVKDSRLTAPDKVCVNSYASMHAFLEDNDYAETMVNWRITYPDGTVLNHRYDQQAGYPGGHHPDFRYMSGPAGQSVTFDVKQIGVYTIRVTIEYYRNGTLRTSNSRTQTFTAYDCTMDECEGTYTPATNFKETFGTFTVGSPRQQVQAPATVGYNFRASGDLVDNDYSVYYSARLGGKAEWDNVFDHTDNGNGGMLIANSADEPKLFYSRRIDGLCPGAKYNFSAWFINLNSLGVLSGVCQQEDYRYAGVTFVVRNATTNSIIKTFNTYDVSMDLSRNLPGDQRLTGWQQYGGTVTLAPGEENVVVEIVNNNPGGCGNDIAVDDIEFVFCAPKIYSYIDGLGVDNDMVCPGAELTLTSVIEPVTYFANPVYRWEMNKNGAGWVSVTAPGYTGVNTPILHIGSGVLQEEDYIQYRLMVFEAGNVTTRACYTPSNMVILSVPKLPSIMASRPKICRGEVTTLTASPLETSGITGYETFQFVGPNIMTWPTLPIPKDKVMVNPIVTSTYEVTGSISYGSYGNGQPRVCTKQASIQIEVDQPPTVDLGPDHLVCVSTPVTLDAGAANTVYPILWSPTNLTTQTITVNAPAVAGTQQYRATVTNGECQVNDVVNVTAVAYPVPVITGQSVFCNPAMMPLSAVEPDLGYTGEWTIIGNDYGASISNPTSASGAQLMNMPYDQAVKVRWTVTATGTSCTDYVEKDYIKESEPVATIGANQTLCSNVFTLAANAPPNATMQGTWTATGTGTVTFGDIHDPNTTATIVTGTTFTLRWTMAKITPGAVCGPVFKTMTITYSAPPAINITSTTITACTGGTNQFSVPYTQSNAARYDLFAVGPNALPGFVDLTNATFAASPIKFNIPAGTVAGTYTFRMVVRKTTPITCEAEALFSVRIETPSTIPTVTVANPTICAGSSTTLTANGTLGSNAQWVWYKGGCGSGVSVGTGATITVSPTVNTTYYVRAESTGPCATTTCGNATVTVNQMPANANAGPDQEKCNTTTFALDATAASIGTGTWTLPPNVTLISGPITNPKATVSVPAGETVTLTWTVTNGVCTSTPDQVVLSNLSPVANNTISASQQICPGTPPAQLNGAGAPTGGNGTYTYQWQISTTSASSGFAPVGSATSDSYQPTAPTQTTWYRRVVTSGACISTSNVVEIRLITGMPAVTSTPAPKTVECQTGTDYTLEFGTPAFSHPDGLTLTITHNDVTTPQTCGMTITRTWTATDPCGKTASTSQTITVQDNTDPVFTTPAPANATVQCNSVPTQPDLTATDNCSATVNVVKAETRTNGSCPNSYTLTRTWTATDDCGNQIVATQTITVVDNTAPVFTTPAPANATVQCDAVPPQLTLTATDNCAGTVTVSMNEVRTNGSCPNSYTLTRTWTATDACGNETVATQTIIVVDDTAPVFTTTAPANVTVQCGAVPAQPDLVATDNCATTVNVVKNEVRTNGSCQNSYTLTRTWTATDECGNQTVATQTITVVDDTDPVFTTPVPADATVQCDNVPTQPDLVATDNCSATVNVVKNEVRTNGSCPNDYTLTRTWTATDECGNQTVATQVITVIDDTDPVFTTPVPANVTVQCDNVPTQPTLTATDNCAGTVTVSMNEVRTNGSCPNNYILTRTWTATDACGNQTVATQTITVIDDTDPVFTTPVPANVTVQCDNVPTQPTLTATDNCAGTVTVSMNEVRTNGSCPNNYTLTRTWTATDECGNQTVATQTITVIDDTDPVFNTPVPANVTVQCDAVPAQSTLTATDNCAGTVTVSMNEVRTNGSCPNSYTLTRTWTATDACGNQTVATQTITVEDNTAPVFTTSAPANLTVECDAVPVQPNLAATDNCTVTVNVVKNEVRTNGSCQNSYTLTRTWTATDECGNQTVATQVITVEDNTAPTFTIAAPANVTVECDAIPTPATLTATDNCSVAPNVTVTMDEVRTNGTCANNYTLVRTWTATDECGNIATVSQTITVEDHTAPTFTVTAPANITVECDAIPAPATLTATDNCSVAPNVTVTMDEVRTNGTCANNYTLVRTWTATDECGNVATVSQTITVEDHTAPTFTVGAPANVTVECDAIPTAPTLTATDNCSATANVTVTMAEVQTAGTCANSYTLVRTWTATDQCGNVATVSQTITVEDHTAPTFTVTAPANVTVECDAIPAPATLTATDNCSVAPNVTVTMDEVRTNGTCANNYTLVRTWTATDECGNVATVSQTITVEDHTAPTFTVTAPANVTVECDAIPAPATLTATDNCSVAPNVTVTMDEVRTNGTCVNNYTLVRTWTATDECGNIATVSQTITVEDHTAPTFTIAAPANVTVECDAIPAPATLTATDNCSVAPNVTVTMDEVRTNGTCANNYTLVRTWTATDECGNTTTVSQTITVEDHTAPTFTVTAPANVTVECDAIPTPATLTATDNCSVAPNVTVTMDEVRTNGTCANNYTLVRTWTATDECGNVATVSQTITVEDHTAPTFTIAAPANVTVECDAIPAPATLTATDNCSVAPNVTVTMDEVRTNGTCANNYTLVRTWTATDECGNVATVSQTITVEDHTAPTFTIAAPANVTVECDAIPAPATLTATDNCSVAPNVTVTMDEVRTNGTCANNYTLVRTWTATDECGNVATVSQTITVEDHTAPTFTVTAPANVTVECDAIPTPATLTATDNCSVAPNVTVTMDEVRTNGTCANNYTLVRTWTATDECGNVATVSQTITVEDHTAPTFTIAAPANVTVECDAIPAPATLTATDNCSVAPNVTVTMDEVRTNGTCANNYTLVRTWTATDECGNTATVSQTITVEDHTAPTFTVTAPANVTVECDAIPTPVTLTATDNCSVAPNVTVTMDEVRTNGTCANNYTLVRTWTATDECGNVATVSQTITVEDHTAPTFTVTAPANVTVECDAIPAPATLTATDNCSVAPNVTVTMDEVRTNGTCANNYTLVRTWTATDECGNTATVAQTITVEDHTAPTFTVTAPANVTVECDAIPAPATLTATDNCSLAAGVTVTMAEVRTNGTCANNYTLVRTWTATDECGNVATVSQTITVEDHTAPTFTVTTPANVTVECDAIPAPATLTATDNCSVAPNVTVTMDEVRTNGTCANNYTLVRTWTATDECGNVATVSQTITVEDHTAPTFTVAAPANVTVECNTIPAPATLTATDNCSVAPNVTVTMDEVRTNGTCANNYTLVRTWTATDECGNIATVSQTITVEDHTAPTFTVTAPANVTVECDAIPAPATLTATDNCSVAPNVTVTMAQVRTNGTCANNYTLVRTWTATDECGNVATVSQTITVEDHTAPTFTVTAPANITVECDAIPAPATLTATDNCSVAPNVTVTMAEVRTNGTCANNYTLVRTWTAMDECGNTTTVSQTITVEDHTAPTFTIAAPANVTVECDAVPTAPILTATDNCSTAANVTVTMTETRTNGACDNSYTLLRTWTATDQCGNTASVSQTITVQDITSPTFTTVAPANVTVECNAIPAQPDLAATDNCSTGTGVTVTKNEVRQNIPNACANNYLLIRTWTATDECGNTTTISQTITVEDNTAPTFTTTAPANVTVECDAIPVQPTLAATDNCSTGAGVTVTMAETRTNGTCANNYTLTRTWTATDECGNSTTLTQIITVQDVTPPVFVAPAPANVTVECNAIPVQQPIAALDNCSATATVTVTMNETRTNGACANSYTLLRTWTATDECGNRTTISQTITVEDHTAPVFTTAAPANITVECDAIPTQPTLAATDNCSATANVTVLMNETRQPIPGRCVNNYLLIRTWTALDECNNAITVTQTITVVDNTAPTFTTAAPANVTVECNNIPAAPLMTATDNCSMNNVTVTFNEVRNNIPGACVNHYELVRTWTATDECGNTASVSQTITVEDRTAPVFTTTAPANVTVQCNAVPAQPDLAATDNCSATANITLVKNETRVNGACANSYQLIRTWTATDECGNNTTITQTVTVVDNTKPTFTTTPPADVTVECNAIPAAPLMLATDNCSVAANVTIAFNEQRIDIPGACDNNYKLLRTWTATDECGNATTVMQVITVQDTTAPTFTVAAPADATVDCNAIPVQPAMTATDNCSVPANVTVVTAERRENIPGACINNYRLVRTWTATDECGNARTVTQILTVQDTTRPVFNMPVPVDITVECNAIPAQPNLTATDNCSTGAGVTVTRSERTEQIPGAMCAGNYRLIRTWTATDECGNSTTVTQTVTVEDHTAPTFTMPTPVDVTVECNAIPAQPNLTATDNCTPTNNITIVKNERRESIPGAMCANNYRLIRTWTATDLCGNATTVTQTILVQDNTAPTFTMPTPADVTVECNAIPVQPNLTVTDNCTPTNNITIVKNERREDIPGACANNYRLIRTWTATDECGNTSTVQQVLTVADRTAPNFTVATPADATVECNAIPVQPDLAAMDNCSVASRVIIVKNERRENIPGACANNYRLIRTWTATDECGNSRTVQQVLTVRDTTKPVFNVPVPANVTVECNAIPVQPSLTATDNCSVSSAVVITMSETKEATPGACVNNYRLIRTWTATDECGNSTTVEQTVTVQDKTAPVFNIIPPANITVNCDEVPAAPVLTAMDNCSGNNVQIAYSFTRQQLSATCINNYRLNRTWTVTDECGNKAVVTQIVTVIDTTAPAFNAPAPRDTTVSCDAIPAPYIVTASDNCSLPGSVTITHKQVKETIAGACKGNYRLINTWTAKDECGNTSVLRQVITVVDTTRPVIAAAPADITIACGVAIPTADIKLRATDNCDGTFPKMVSYTIDPYVKDNCSGYTIIRRWKVSDECGNAAQDVTQRIIVLPCPKPELEADVVVNCSSDPFITLRTKGVVNRPVYTLVGVTPANAVQVPVTSSNPRFNVNGATTASFIVRDGITGCASDTMTYSITYLQMPKVNLGNDTSLCGGNGMVLDAGAANFGYQIKWSTGETTQRIRVTQPGTYKVTINNGMCTATDEIKVGVIPMPLIDLPDTTICRGQNVILNATVDGGSYLWSTGSTNPSINVSTQETFWVRVTKNGCITIDTINVSVNPPPDISLSRDTSICPGQSVMLTVNTNAGRIQWGTGEIGNSIMVSKAGNYSVAVYRDNCVVRETVRVAQRPDMKFDLGPDRIICPGGSVLIDARNPDASTYRWNDGDLNPVKSLSQSGKYIIGVLDKYCDRYKEDSINITVAGPPTVNLGNDTTICKGRRFTLRSNAKNATSYLWSNGQTGSSIEVSQPGTYTVTAFNDCGSTTDEITIDVTECDSRPDFPNAFSPNGDGNNDVFRPVVRGPMYDYELRIYNRWGELVFISKDMDKGWNGWYKGRPVDIGTFVWWLTYKKVTNGPAFVIKGDVTVIR